MNTTIFGTDYVGLITGACPADMGHRVICVDMDHTKRETYVLIGVELRRVGRQEVQLEPSFLLGDETFHSPRLVSGMAVNDVATLYRFHPLLLRELPGPRRAQRQGAGPPPTGAQGCPA